MNNYNINMKKFNGTDYDNLLPLAYNALNSQQLDGKTFGEIENIFTRTDLYLYTNNYIGRGVYGEYSPTVLTFPFEPVIIFMPAYMTNDSHGVDIIQTRMVTTSYISTYNSFANYQNAIYYIKCSTDRKTFSLYSDNATTQYNGVSVIYWFAAIGGYDTGNRNEWLWSTNTTPTNYTFVVPKTGRYTLELYGGGGGSAKNSTWTGGSSCQTYDVINLTKGETLAITVGAAGSGYTGQQGGTTSFGSYTVAGATNATDSSGGNGAGNKGVNGSNAGTYGAFNYSSGSWRERYGYGVSAVSGGDTDGWASGGAPGAVYLKYLGA